VWKEELDKIQRLSKSDFWSNWYDEMARKTAIRRLCKQLDICPELQRAIAIEERNEGELMRDCTPRPNGAAASLKEKLLPPPAEEKPVDDVAPTDDSLDFPEDKIPDE
jgi:recombination protein RecT